MLEDRSELDVENPSEWPPEARPKFAHLENERKKSYEQIKVVNAKNGLFFDLLSEITWNLNVFSKKCSEIKSFVIKFPQR